MQRVIAARRRLLVGLSRARRFAGATCRRRRRVSIPFERARHTPNSDARKHLAARPLVTRSRPGATARRSHTATGARTHARAHKRVRHTTRTHARARARAIARNVRGGGTCVRTPRIHTHTPRRGGDDGARRHRPSSRHHLRPPRLAREEGAGERRVSARITSRTDRNACLGATCGKCDSFPRRRARAHAAR